MPTYKRPDLLETGDSLALAEHLREAGMAVTIDRLAGTITTDQDAAALLDAYTPVAEWDGLPGSFRTHVQHLRDYRQAVRDGQLPTQAQTAHAVADIIDALRLLKREVTGD